MCLRSFWGWWAKWSSIHQHTKCSRLISLSKVITCLNVGQAKWNENVKTLQLIIRLHFLLFEDIGIMLWSISSYIRALLLISIKTVQVDYMSGTRIALGQWFLTTSIDTPVYLRQIISFGPIVGPWPLFIFLILHTVGTTPWTEYRFVARPLPTYRTTQTQTACVV
jgi:hypothetical protein